MAVLRLASDLAKLAERDADIAREWRRLGTPKARSRPPGFAALLRIIVGQQVSAKAAAAMWRKLEAALERVEAERVADATLDDLRALGLSRQKAGYALGLARDVVEGRLDIAALARLDEDMAIAELTRVKGIGRWSADIYLLFALRRGDVFPAGDLALQIAFQRLKRLRRRPDADRLRRLVAPWSPQRGAGAVFLWHFYANPPLE
jgi:DNA-3-methyladenine glycosylase II